MGFSCLFVHYFDVLLILAMISVSYVESMPLSVSEMTTSIQITILFVYFGVLITLMFLIVFVIVLWGRKKNNNKQSKKRKRSSSNSNVDDNNSNNNSHIINEVLVQPPNCSTTTTPSNNHSDSLAVPQILPIVQPTIATTTTTNVNPVSVFSPNIGPLYQQPVPNTTYHFHAGSANFVFPTTTIPSDIGVTHSSMPMISGFGEIMRLLMGNSMMMTNTSTPITSPALQLNNSFINTAFSSSSAIPTLSSSLPSTSISPTSTPTSSIPISPSTLIHSQEPTIPLSTTIIPDNTNEENSSDSFENDNENNDSVNNNKIDKNSKVVCQFCAKLFATKKTLQHHISHNYCLKKPVTVHEHVMKQFNPYKSTSRYFPIYWDENSLFEKLIGIWSQYVKSESPNYFKTILDTKLHYKIKHDEPLEHNSMLTYKSNLSKFLFWMKKSFPISVSEIAIVESLFNWDSLNTIILEFQKMKFWLPKTFCNFLHAFRRFMVMLIDVDFLHLHNFIYLQLKSFVTKLDCILSIKTKILPSLDIKANDTTKQVKKTQQFSRTREKLESAKQWVNFPKLIEGWNKALIQIQNIVKKSVPDKTDHPILAQFLAFTIAVKLPPMRAQNLSFFLYSTESKVLKQLSILNDPTKKSEKQNYGTFNNTFTQFDLYYTKYKTFHNYGVIYRSFSGEIASYFHYYVKLTQKLFKIDLMDGGKMFFESIYAKPGTLIKKAIKIWVNSKLVIGMQSIRYSISTFNAEMGKKDELSKNKVKLIEEGCLHSPNVAAKIYDKPSVKQKGN